MNIATTVNVHGVINAWHCTCTIGHLVLPCTVSNIILISSSHIVWYMHTFTTLYKPKWGMSNAMNGTGWRQVCRKQLVVLIWQYRARRFDNLMFACKHVPFLKFFILKLKSKPQWHISSCIGKNQWNSPNTQCLIWSSSVGVSLYLYTGTLWWSYCMNFPL